MVQDAKAAKVVLKKRLTSSFLLFRNSTEFKTLTSDLYFYANKTPCKRLKMIFFFFGYADVTRLNSSPTSFFNTASAVQNFIFFSIFFFCCGLKNVSKSLHSYNWHLHVWVCVTSSSFWHFCWNVLLLFIRLFKWPLGSSPTEKLNSFCYSL